MFRPDPIDPQGRAVICSRCEQSIVIDKSHFHYSLKKGRIHECKGRDQKQGIEKFRVPKYKAKGK